MASKKPCMLHQAAAIRHVLRRCTSLARRQQHGAYSTTHCDVPKGHFVVYVGDKRARHVVPIKVLSRPEFLELLRLAEEEFGFGHNMGLTIPCDEDAFRSLIVG
ncbi:hypothetical protein MLD38_022210 [Melastoma candidum]|uniref:Uncharacterized protein n=1 Tax=Melastoma candidum TaxID=119954 RepID=A0ACB9QRN3_9MYRT|nr:hypothetical protein MLD38_022210 [Melastoma candidum]